MIGGMCCLLLTPLETGPAMGSEKVLYAFQSGADGLGPQARLIRGGNGSLYGTTVGGGGGTQCNNEKGGCGTVFRITSQGTETVLYAFSGGSDGGGPWSNLVVDASGNLYGTTEEGGLGAGTVFKLTPNGKESVLYALEGAPDGLSPRGNLVADNSGNLYGTTILGGNTGGDECQSLGCGTVFKVAPDGTETVLHVFRGGSDGFEPLGGVILDSQGNLYGTTLAGGGSGCGDSFGCGTVFEVTPDGTETVLYAFQGGNDGAFPEDAPMIDGSGNLNGTTFEGGASNRGTVFKLAPDGTEGVLFEFSYGSDGYFPLAGLIEDGGGNLYGTTSDGGVGCDGGGCGTVFELTPEGKEKVLYSFKKARGAHPAAGLLMGSSGTLYGTAPRGGKHKDGVVFRVKE
jgi:uncharacterized repeat protein (TIGR03803 family)